MIKTKIIRENIKSPPNLNDKNLNNSAKKPKGILTKSTFYLYFAWRNSNCPKRYQIKAYVSILLSKRNAIGTKNRCHVKITR